VRTAGKVDEALHGGGRDGKLQAVDLRRHHLLEEEERRLDVRRARRPQPDASLSGGVSRAPRAGGGRTLRKKDWALV
jgi:hypothetical protein